MTDPKTRPPLMGLGPRRPSLLPRTTSTPAPPAAPVAPPKAPPAPYTCPRCSGGAVAIFESPRGVRHCGCAPFELEGEVEYHRQVLPEPPASRPWRPPSEASQGLRATLPLTPRLRASAEAPEARARALIAAWASKGGGLGALEALVVDALAERVELDAKALEERADRLLSEGRPSDDDASLARAARWCAKLLRVKLKASRPRE